MAATPTHDPQPKVDRLQQLVRSGKEDTFHHRGIVFKFMMLHSETQQGVTHHLVMLREEHQSETTLSLSSTASGGGVGVNIKSFRAGTPRVPLSSLIDLCYIVDALLHHYLAEAVSLPSTLALHGSYTIQTPPMVHLLSRLNVVARLKDSSGEHHYELTHGTSNSASSSESDAMTQLHAAAPHPDHERLRELASQTSHKNHFFWHRGIRYVVSEPNIAGDPVILTMCEVVDGKSTLQASVHLEFKDHLPMADRGGKWSSAGVAVSDFFPIKRQSALHRKSKEALMVSLMRLVDVAVHHFLEAEVYLAPGIVWGRARDEQVDAAAMDFRVGQQLAAQEALVNELCQQLQLQRPEFRAQFQTYVVKPLVAHPPVHREEHLPRVASAA